MRHRDRAALGGQCGAERLQITAISQYIIGAESDMSPQHVPETCFGSGSTSALALRVPGFRLDLGFLVTGFRCGLGLRVLDFGFSLGLSLHGFKSSLGLPVPGLESVLEVEVPVTIKLHY